MYTSPLDVLTFKCVSIEFAQAQKGHYKRGETAKLGCAGRQIAQNLRIDYWHGLKIPREGGGGEGFTTGPPSMGTSFFLLLFTEYMEVFLQ